MTLLFTGQALPFPLLHHIVATIASPGHCPPAVKLLRWLSRNIHHFDTKSPQLKKSLMKEIIPGQMRCKLLRTGRDHRRVRLVTNQRRPPRPYLRSSCLTPYRADRSDTHPFLDTLGCNLPAESHGKCPTLLWKHEPSRPLCQQRHTHDHRQRVWWAATGTALLFSASRPGHAARKILATRHVPTCRTSVQYVQLISYSSASNRT